MTELDLQRHLPWMSGLVAVLALTGVLLALILQSQATEAVASRLLGPNATPTALPSTPGPAKLTLTIITSAGCTDCANLSATLKALRSLGTTITGETTLDYQDGRAKELLQRYRADKVPTVLVQGDTRDASLARAWASFGVIREDGTVLFTGQQPPYVNVSTGRVDGRVQLTVLVDERCAVCPDYATALEQFKRVGLAINDSKRIDYNSTEGRRLLAQYNITKVPTVLLSPDAWLYGVVQEAWDRIGTRENDGTLVLRQVNPPYRELKSGTTLGLVTLVNLVDASCTPCYNVAVHRQLLTRLGLVFKNEDTFDISSQRGRQYLAQYNITRVPTVLLSPDASVYPVMGEIWSQLGTTESDGWFVFRNTEALPNLVYYDVPTGKTVGANATAPAGSNATNTTR